MSGDPQLCASLLSDGFDSDEPSHKTKLYAISSRFDLGFDRVARFVSILRHILAQTPAAVRQSDAVQLATDTERTKKILWPLWLLWPRRNAIPAASLTALTQLPIWLDETMAFLKGHHDRYLLLETIELDSMSEREEAALRACVEKEVSRCLHAGAAIDALPMDLEEAGRQLIQATTQKCATPLDAFFGLRLDDECDDTRSGATEHPLGLGWTDILYFDVWNRSEYEAQLTHHPA